MTPDPTPNTEAAPGEAEIKAVAEALVATLMEAENDTPEEYAQWIPKAATAALTAAYAIRLPPLLAELERHREALEEITNVAPNGQTKWVDIARAALEQGRN